MFPSSSPRSLFSSSILSWVLLLLSLPILASTTPPRWIGSASHFRSKHKPPHQNGGFHYAGTGLAGTQSPRTHYHYWRLEWRWLAPDGYGRPVITVNGIFPPPVLIADEGDTVIVDIENALGNQTTSIHWHGQYQRGSNNMDGVGGVTQCPIPPGGSFHYEWKAAPSGTHWWHSHYGEQYPDGLRGLMVIREKGGDERRKSRLQVDVEYVWSVSDW